MRLRPLLIFVCLCLARLAAAQSLLPVPGSTAPVDTWLQMEFDAPPALGSGRIRILRASDGAVVDELRGRDESNVIGTAPDGVRRIVRYSAIQLDGRRVRFYPHDARLAYDTEYLITVDARLFPDARRGGQRFAGIDASTGWRFRTPAAAPQAARIRVDDDGPADFRTIQGALNHAMRQTRSAPMTIAVANGHYQELLYLRGKDKLRLEGESREGVLISAENNDGLNPGVGRGQMSGTPGFFGGRAVFLIEDADELRLDHISIRNTSWRSRARGAQAETLNFASEGRLAVTRSSFYSEQDTILVRGYSWFYRSLIAGNVDFIWGANRAALFEESEIRSLGDSANPERGGYVVQARTREEVDTGFVFLRSRLTHGTGPAGNDVPPASSYLARPGPATTWDRVAYISCEIGPHILASGWQGQERGGSGWYEFDSRDPAGRALDLSQRASGRVLTEAAAARFTSRAAVFASFGGGLGWLPQADFFE